MISTAKKDELINNTNLLLSPIIGIPFLIVYPNRVFFLLEFQPTMLLGLVRHWAAALLVHSVDSPTLSLL